MHLEVAVPKEDRTGAVRPDETRFLPGVREVGADERLQNQNISFI